MNEDGRFIPPGPGRSAAFARQGGFGKSSLSGLGWGLLCASLVLYILKDSLALGWINLFRAGIDNAATRALSPIDSIRVFFSAALELLWPISAAAATGMFAGALVPAFAARRGKGTTSAALPKIPRAGFSVFAIRLFCAGVFIVSLLFIVRRTNIDSLGPWGWLDFSGRLFLRTLAVLGLIFVLAGAAETLILRRLIFHALFLNRSEARREARALKGSRETASKGRRRLRREISP
jgi:flagellar biosynthesis protein FlhB